MIKHLLISFFALSITATAQAGIILSGNIDDTNPLPTTLQQNLGPESDTDVFLYTEQENFLLTDKLGVDYLGSTTNAGFIDAGIRVNSFVLSFDAASNYVFDVNGDYVLNDESFEALGSYLFDTKILGIIWGGTRPDGQQGTIINPGWAPSSGLLDVSDDIFKLSGTTYAEGDVGRGLEPEDDFIKNNTVDTVSVSNSGYQLDFALYSKAIYADQFRVITAVPEPTTLLLFGTAVICLVNLRRFS